MSNNSIRVITQYSENKLLCEPLQFWGDDQKFLSVGQDYQLIVEYHEDFP